MKNLTTFLFLIPFAFALQGQNTYYVSTTGDNAKDGLTEGNAWETLVYAEANATTAGDIIALKKGNTWAIDNVLDINHSGTSANPIVWDGSLWGTGANAIIESSGHRETYNMAIVHFWDCRYVREKYNYKLHLCEAETRFVNREAWFVNRWLRPAGPAIILRWGCSKFFTEDFVVN